MRWHSVQPRSGHVNLGRSFKDGVTMMTGPTRRVATVERNRRLIQPSLTRRRWIGGHHLQAINDLPKIKRR